LLIQAGACVHVVAREVNAQFSQWIAAGRVLHVAHEYEAGLLHGARLVFVATGDEQLNSQVFTDAERMSVLVNVVDERKLCRFISPAVVDRSPIQVAISTGGSAPLLARRLRSWIEALLPLGLDSCERRRRFAPIRPGAPAKVTAQDSVGKIVR
jgi:uroporphyrin-III C-methyltransferase/precorrin-2 dehydrogenase/sirohydrochlorin ferrochelatase